MLKRVIYGGFLIVFVFSFAAFSQEKTKINSSSAKRTLIGKHFLALQWISWEKYGRVDIWERKGVMYLKGSQRSDENDDYLTIDGVITSVDEKEFKFDGKIVTSVSHINGGEACTRESEVTFVITGKRKYWRLKEMDNPCDGVVDYVDIFFLKYK